MFVYISLFISGLSLNTSAEKCVTPNNEEAECTSLYSCSSLLSALGSQNPISLRFVEESNCGGTPARPMVCCGSSSNLKAPEEKKPTETRNLDKMSLLPTKQYCGLQHSDDYFPNENYTVTRITEFPWLAGIVMQDPKDQERILCGGSLINRRYVLTAAHCLFMPFTKLIAVHLGEYNINLEKDCVQEPSFEKECSEPLQVFDIEKIITHPHYSRRNASCDIALIRLNASADYNDYVRPICLPFPGTTVAQVGDVLISSGWGAVEYLGDRPSLKKRIFTKLISIEECQRHYPSSSSSKPRPGNHICVIPLHNSTDFGCKGDGGGPLTFSTKRAQWHLEGISSFGQLCGTSNADVYTKVDNYLDWILENIEE